MRFLFSVLCLTLLLCGCGEKKEEQRQRPESYPVLEEVPKPLPDNFPAAAMVMVEIIEVEFNDFTKWSTGHEMGPESATLLRKDAQQWIAEDRAAVVDTVAVHCPGGGRARTSSVREFRYPVNYAYPTTIESTDDKDDETKKGSDGSSKGKDSDTKEKKPQPKKKPVEKPNPTPVKFDVREAGLTLEVSLISIDSESGVIDLEVNPNLVNHIGTVEWKAADENDLGDFTSPVFETVQIQSSVSLMDGRYALLGIGKIPDGMRRSHPDSDTVLLAFIRADSNKRKTP